MTEQKSDYIGIIDLGSNTARLIVVNAHPGYSFRLEDQIREVVRLRQGMVDNCLSDLAMTRAYSTLKLFKRFCDSTGVKKIIATTTSAVRDAQNGEKLLNRVTQELHIPLRILTGEEEAYYGSLGALNEVPMKLGYVLDIGGGSAQCSQIDNGRFTKGTSLPLGSLALTEQFLHSDPPTESQLTELTDFIDTQLDSIPWFQVDTKRTLVGLGGTIRNLARIEAFRIQYPLNTLHGFKLTLDSVHTTIKQFRALSLEERRAIPGLNSDRADIILAGAYVLISILNRLAVTEITVSESGLREGLFFETFWDHLPYPVMPDVRRFSVINLARIYQYKKNHANYVRFLAGRLFIQLAPLHQFGLPERELLDAAALLHDIGMIIGYPGHHRHSQTIIEYNGLAGFSPREIVIIGLLTRYHRKGMPDCTGYEMILDDESDLQIVFKLSAMLRLAEFLERGQTGSVDDLTINWTDETLRITLIADEYPSVELWQAEQQAVPLMSLAFDRTVILDTITSPDESPFA